MSRYVLILTAALLAISCNRDPDRLKRNYLEAGHKYFQKKKFREASIMYRTAIRKDPRFGEAYYHNSLAMIRSGRLGLAEPSLRRAVELLKEGPERVSSRVQLADLYLAYLNTQKRDTIVMQEIERLAGDLLKLEPKSFDGLRLRGAVLTFRAAEYGGKRPDLASVALASGIADLRAADALRPYQPELVSDLTGALWRSNQSAEAEEYLTGLLRAKPNFASAYRELYRVYSRTNRIGEAEQILLRAAAALPAEVEFPMELARLYQQLGQREKMLQALATVKRLNPDSPQSYELAGKLQAASGNREQGRREFEEGIRRFPKEKHAFQKMIVAALVADNRQSDAVKLNEDILRENPNDADALARRAEYALRRGDVATAIATLDAVLRKSPDHAVAHYNLAQAQLVAGQLENARFHLTEAIRFAPEFLEPRIALVKVQISGGEYGNGVAQAEDILTMSPHRAEASVLKSVALRGLGKVPEARAEIEPLLKTDPQNSEAWFELGAIEASGRRWKEAEAAYRKCYETNRESVMGLIGIADLRINRGETEAALSILREEVSKRPDHLELRLVHGSMASRAGRNDEAIGAFQHILAKAGDNTKARGEAATRLGEIHLRMGNYREALGHLEKARQFRPGDPATLHSLGVVYDALGRRKEAAATYEAGLTINGRNPVMLNNLAYYLAENGGDLERALTLAQRAHQASPNMPAYADTVATIYLKKNLVDNALEILEELVSKNPKEAVFRLHLGEALLQKGEKARAKKELTTALASKASAEDTARIKALLEKTGA